MTTSLRAPGKDIAFIHLLRLVAVSMVLYDHLIAIYAERWKDILWMPPIWLNTYLFTPFGIIQSMGFIGVSLFFLVSGYIITHAASSETRREFLIKRVLRIYPPLIGSVLVCVICQPGTSRDIGDILLNFTLLNYVSVPQVIIQGVAWSLVIEMSFLSDDPAAAHAHAA